MLAVVDYMEWRNGRQGTKTSRKSHMQGMSKEEEGAVKKEVRG